jgi:hypothetical protein
MTVDPGDAASITDAGDGGMPTRSGWVAVSPVADTRPAVAISGYFADSLHTGPAWFLSMNHCAITQASAACIAYTCASATPTADTGALTARLPDGTVVQAMQVDGFIGGVATRVYGGVAEGSTIGATDVVRFQAAGASVPSFAGMVAMPPSLTDIHLPAVISRSSDLVLTWSARVSDRVSVVIMEPPFSTTPPRHGVWCSWPGGTSTVTVPASALSTFADGEAVAISAGLVNVTPIVVGDYAIDLEASQSIQATAMTSP